MQGNKIIIPFAKPSGITSFNSLKAFKSLHKKTKVGHSGTLDSFADGLMLGLIDKGTKLSFYFTNCDKTYLAQFVFGIETNTLDSVGTVADRRELPKREKLFSVIKSFVGKQKQVPPNYSRVQLGGNRAYQMALSGNEIKLNPRDIEVYSIKVLDYTTQGDFVKTLSLEIHCSKGTYIRALCRDIARAADSCAFVGTLRRCQIGTFTLKDCLWNDRLPDFKEQCLLIEKKLEVSEPPLYEDKKTLPSLELSEYQAYAKKFSPHIAKSLGLGLLYLRSEFVEAFKRGQKISLDYFEQNYDVEMFLGKNKNAPEQNLKKECESIEEDSLASFKKAYAVFCNDDFLGLVSFEKNHIKYNFVF